MEVRVISTETIKPSSPTPHHRRTHMLSLLDQLATRSYPSIVLFYSAAGETNSDHLKKSLAATLTNFYPLAGRVSENVSCIHCNDDGAIYVEAEIAGDMSVVLEQPEIEQIQKLLPRDPNKHVLTQLSDQEILAIQVNHFRCGGIAIGVSVSHVIADMSTLTTFVQSWNAVSRGDNVITDVIFDSTSLFRPIASAVWGNRGADITSSPPKAVTKRLVFDGCKIAALRERIEKESELDRPTRVEAVSALIWGAFIVAVRERDETIKNHAARTLVDIRRRVSPAFPRQAIGNIVLGTTGNISIQNTPNYGDLARTLRDAIRKVDDEYVRKVDVLGEKRSFLKMTINKESMVETFGIICWCKFPFYEIDFGWGEPIWVGNGQQTNKAAIFIDTRDGKGIEAWVTLPEEYLIPLEHNPDILQYASFGSIK